MLMNKNWAEHEERRIILKETPACQNVFEVLKYCHEFTSLLVQCEVPTWIILVQVFLKYLYTGKIQVDYANVIPILQLADKYNVKDLLRYWAILLPPWILILIVCFFRVGLDFMSRNVALAARKNQVGLKAWAWSDLVTNISSSIKYRNLVLD